MKVRLFVRGPSVQLLASYLASKQGWVIYDAAQTGLFSGFIDGGHIDPYRYIGFSINDGTYIRSVSEASDGNENTD